ncbi:MAG: substrate-binding domain-containing protein [Anaerolineae bacterium]|nr:substrate-binding domain-containing protein [Anaerolineae bacterium]
MRHLSLVLLILLLAACGGPTQTASAPKAAATTAPTAPTTAPVAPTAVPPSPVPPTATKAPATATTAPTAAPTTAPAAAKPANPDLILATTTSTQDSGLLDVLIPRFQTQTGYVVKTVAVGSGQAMTMGERGEADVLLVHSPDAEVKFMEGGHGTKRLLVMHNDFIIIGPPADPAKIKDIKSSVDALKKIADAKALFLSRGDNSGTDALEKKLWGQAGSVPKGQTWYQETGQGMGATLNVANEKEAYTITDRATYLARKKDLKLDILVEGDKPLLNIYHVIPVNPTKSPRINAAGGQAFADFMVASDTQKFIAAFGVDKYGTALFFPDAGKSEAEVGQ